MNLNGHFVNARTSGLRGYFLLDMSGIHSHVTIDDNGFRSEVGTPAPADEPRATITCFPPSILMRLMGHGLAVEEAEGLGLLTITGDREAALELITLLSFSDS